MKFLLNATARYLCLGTLLREFEAKGKGTQREYNSKQLEHSIVKRILVFKQ